MAMLRNLSCHCCRQSTLRSLIVGLGGPSLYPPAPPTAPVQRQPFSITAARYNEAHESIKQEAHALDAVEYVANEAQTELQQALVPSAAHSLPPPSTPWYLQQLPFTTPPPTDNPLAARQRIPDLPTQPPPLLHPLLHHLSIDLGIDSLELLDLRTLDPPPALGANLLMLIGTARSDKHLHVSADRLCRWLRTTHRLTPYADGLLGRKEVKLKLRRRAKRTRLVGARGVTGDAAMVEEGVRTGWVCVNVGRVQGGELPSREEIRTDEGLVGFGTRKEGCAIAVQLMTEEKRGEIALERLWTGMLKRAEKEKKDIEEAELAEEDGKMHDSETVDDQVEKAFGMSAVSYDLRELQVERHAVP